MSTLKKYTPFFLSALLMYVVLFIIYPHYQYYVDPDGSAYLTISKRYAAGNIQKAINGYWSPWSCWLTAILIKCGLAAIPASVIINTLGATGFLFISQSFFLRFNIVERLQWLLNLTLALFLCYAIFGQSFDDLWECFFLLATLRMMLADKFIKQPALWMACGIIGALAYFAKAYSFPFFILNTLCCVYLLTGGNKKKWLQISITSTGVMFLCSLAWIMALHNKYHIWATSTAGTLNMSWYLVGHPYWRDGIDLLLPPFYSDSPSYWEDPWYANGATPHFWSSWYLFGLQILRVGLNTYKFIISNLQLSVFFPVISAVAFLSLFSNRVRCLFSNKTRIMVVSFVLFPLAFFLINFESRYIWYMLPLGMVMGGITIQNMQANSRKGMLMIIFPLTFLVYPLWNMNKMYDEGRRDYETAQQLTLGMGIRGAFASTAKPGIERQRMQRIAYFSGMQFYNLSRLNYTEKDILAEMKRYDVKYLFIYRSMEPSSRPELIPSHDALPAPRQYIDSTKDLKIIYVDIY